MQIMFTVFRDICTFAQKSVNHCQIMSSCLYLEDNFTKNVENLEHLMAANPKQCER